LSLGLFVLFHLWGWWSLMWDSFTSWRWGQSCWNRLVLAVIPWSTWSYLVLLCVRTPDSKVKSSCVCFQAQSPGTGQPWASDLCPIVPVS
jgi:hypothetical protein